MRRGATHSSLAATADSRPLVGAEDPSPPPPPLRPALLGCCCGARSSALRDSSMDLASPLSSSVVATRAVRCGAGVGKETRRCECDAQIATIGVCALRVCALCLCVFACCINEVKGQLLVEIEAARPSKQHELVVRSTMTTWQRVPPCPWPRATHPKTRQSPPRHHQACRQQLVTPCHSSSGVLLAQAGCSPRKLCSSGLWSDTPDHTSIASWAAWSLARSASTDATAMLFSPCETLVVKQATQNIFCAKKTTFCKQKTTKIRFQLPHE
jgi:hypothetical protein